MTFSQKKTSKEARLKPLLDYGPLLIFFVTYWLYGLRVATVSLIGSTAFFVAIALVVLRTLPLIPLITAVVVGVFGGLTLFFHNDIFIKMKPTIVQLVLALVLFLGLLRKSLLIKKLMTEALIMEDRHWVTLTWRFIIFFLVSALLNEAVWRTQTTSVWVTFKVFGLLGLTFLFVLTQAPFLYKHARPPHKEDEGSS